MRTKEDGEFVDFYELLGIAPDADSKQIRAAFLQKAQEHHPDVGGSAATMQQLNEAYKILKNPTAKLAYDTAHGIKVGANQDAHYSYSGGKDVDDMSDTEIDQFLDTMLAEFRHGVPDVKKATVKERIKKMFEI